MAITLERKRLFPGFDGKLCKVNPHMMTDGKRYVLSWTMLVLAGSDVFYDDYVSYSNDCARTFSEPVKLPNRDIFNDGVRNHFTPSISYYSKYYNKWLKFYSCEQYANDMHRKCFGREVTYSTPYVALFDPEKGDITGGFKKIPLPFDCPSACPFGQIIEYDNGEMLLSFYTVKENQTHPYRSTVTARYILEDGGLKLVSSGTPISGESVPDSPQPGFLEPSVAQLNGKYYITLRNEFKGYFAESEDGLSFSEPKPWVWENGEPIGSYRTMQRWVRFGDALYLIYTRPNGLNDHVFRNRAPLYMTRFDDKRGCLVRNEEIILVPELGARLGNFSVTDISPNEAVLTVAEWMQPAGCDKYGSDNSIWVVRVKKG